VRLELLINDSSTDNFCRRAVLPQSIISACRLNLSDDDDATVTPVEKNTVMTVVVIKFL